MFINTGVLRASDRALDKKESTATHPVPTYAASTARPLPAGKFTEVRIPILPFAYAFRAGSRIRVTITAPGGDRPVWAFATYQTKGRVTDTIGLGGDTPSALVLSVVRGLQPPDPNRRAHRCAASPAGPTRRPPTVADVRAAAPADPGLEWGAGIVAWRGPRGGSTPRPVAGVHLAHPAGADHRPHGAPDSAVARVEDVFDRLVPGAPAIGEEARAHSRGGRRRRPSRTKSEPVSSSPNSSSSMSPGSHRHSGPQWPDLWGTTTWSPWSSPCSWWTMSSGRAGHRPAVPVGRSIEFGSAPGSGPGTDGSAPHSATLDVGTDVLMAELDEVLRAVARLTRLDPVTTELVRLRGARHHNCWLCKSIRSAAAVRAVGQERWFEQIEAYESSDLDDQKLALRLTDAVLSQPAGIGDELTTAVRSHFSDAQTVELVLDIFRNSSQKIAVSLGADQPHVDSGIELFELTTEGSLVFSS